MKMSDLYTMPLINVLQQMEMKDFKVHTDDEGVIRAIEVKYTPKEMERKQ